MDLPVPGAGFACRAVDVRLGISGQQ